VTGSPGSAGADEPVAPDGSTPTTDADRRHATGPGPDAYARVSALAGAAVGFVVWLVAPWVAGQAEPWDAAYPLYSITLISSGILLGLLGPRPRRLGWLTAWIGAWAGQVAALVLLPWLEPAALSIGALVTGLGSSLFVIGTVAGTLIGLVARR